MRARILGLAAPPLLVLTGFATAAASHTLDTVTVTTSRQEQPLLDTPSAVTVVDTEAAQRGRPNLQLDEALNRVPGLFFQNRYNFAQNLRLSSRGFGARSPFGVRGLHLRVDGLPITLPDGQSQVDAIDLDSVRRVEVLRGPASSLYGNAAGGVVLLHTADGSDGPPGASVSVEGGGDGYRKANLQQQGRNADGSHHVSVTALGFDGQRQQSRVEKYQLDGHWRHALAGGELTTLVNLLDEPTAEDPGGLTRAQVDANRDQASRFARLLDAGQTVRQQRIGAVYRHPWAEGEWQGSLHYTHRDFEQQLPFPGSSLLGYQRHFYGGDLRYSGQAGPLAYTLGTEVSRQEDDRYRFNVNADGTRAARSGDEQQNATAAGLFGQATLPLSPTWSWTLGSRLDRVQLAIGDRFAADGDNDGHQRFNEYSYSTGLNWRPVPGQQLYASVGSAFETPTFSEFANPDGGGFNPDLEPQKAINREIGARGTLNPRWRYEVAVFSVSTRDEIVPYDVSGQTFYRNAGRTRRDGIELGLTWFPDDWTTVSAAWTWGHYRFRDDQSNGQDLDGNALPGLPENQLYLEYRRDFAGGGFAALETLMVDSVYAEDSNQTRVPGYALVNGRVGHRWQGAGQRALTVYLSARNLLDRDYIANLRINTNSDRPLDERGYFEPGPGRTWIVGLEAKL
ncbi:TonB-dependent receptor family protein [Alloalcanivorax mobilis]|uniref:TonB-dependent receptor family protein n=1 Tax=Alloalcanivorax mobilis TaxID=2019569 RepID=UPI000C77ACFE|nr:TonB-dependent receptor [Alloalcanivorax mobilis]